MTLLGKIFTVLIFIMSILFMGFSVVVYATHKNWKMLVTNPTPTEEYDLGLVQRLEQLRETNSNLRTELDEIREQLAMEKAARRHALGALYTKLTEAEERLAAKEGVLQEKEAALGEAAETAKLAEQTAEALRKEVEGLRGEIRTAQLDRDKQFEKVVALTDELHKAVGLERNLKEYQVNLLKQITDMQTVLNAHGLKAGMDVTGVAPPLDGIVTKVGEKNLIEVSIGSDDGLRVGHRLEVFRGNTYLGQAQVLRTDPDRSVCKIDEKSQRGLVKERDRVATRLNRTTTG